jgi:hypothetical protein
MAFRRDYRAESLASGIARRYQIVLLTGIIAGCVLARFATYAYGAGPPTTASSAAIASPAPPASGTATSEPTASQIATLTDQIAATLSPRVPNGWSVIINMVILLAAVAVLVVVFRVFGLAKHTEALGMPANSVRALLALIVLVMLATLGAQFLMR